MFLANVVLKFFKQRDSEQGSQTHSSIPCPRSGGRHPLRIANGFELAKLFYGIDKFIHIWKNEFMALSMECSVKLTDMEQKKCGTSAELCEISYTRLAKNNLKSRGFFFFKFLLAKSCLRNRNQVSLPLVPLSTFYNGIVYSVLEGLVLVKRYSIVLTSTCKHLPSL